MKILVTGGLGFLGSNLSLRLVKEGHEVTVLDIDQKSPRLDELRGKVNIVYGDVREKFPVTVALKGKDAVIHLCGEVSHYRSMLDPYIDFDVNVNGTLNILQAMRKNDVGLLLYASSRSVYGIHDKLPIRETDETNPIDCYGVSKLASEKLCKVYSHHYGLRTVIFRQANLVGPRQQLWTPEYQLIGWVFRCFFLGQPIRFQGDGYQTRDFLDVDDCCLAYETALENPEVDGVFNLGGCSYLSWREVFEIAEETLGRKVSISYIPYEPMREKLENRESILSYEKAENVMGWRPTTPLENSFLKMKEYYDQEERWKKYANPPS